MLIYRMQMKYAKEDGNKNIVSEALKQHKITCNEDYAQANFNNLKFGDIVFIHAGSYPKAIVKVLHRIPDADIQEPSFGIDYKVEILSMYEEALNEFPNIEFTPPHTSTFVVMETDKDTYKKVKEWYSLVTNKQKMQNYITLLQQKYQIILQGAPGTGKTRLAKEIANSMIRSRKIDKVDVLVDNFFREFQLTENIKEKRNERSELLRQFHQKFPIASIQNISLSDYAIGTGTGNSFCWWLERGLKELGYYFPGSSKSYLIYWSKTKQDYSKHGKLLKDIVDTQTAMKKLAETLYLFLKDKDMHHVDGFLGKSLLLKLLNTYYPNEYFPINSSEHINNALAILKIPHQNNENIILKNSLLQKYYEDKKSKHNSLADSFDFMDFLYQVLNIRTLNEVDGEVYASNGECKLIQFHPAYSYEDFVRGIVAKTKNNRISYEVENKILAEMAGKAQANPDANYILIIDEINRANLPAVLGELIYALEYRDQAVESLYALGDSEDARQLILPSNLYIIGTMNTADRSVGHIDYAIRRRFAFVTVPPNEDVIKNDKAKTLFKTIKEIFEKNRSSDFQPDDIMIGHSYFLVEKDEELDLKLEYEIKPILREYVKDGILTCGMEKINNLKIS